MLLKIENLKKTFPGSKALQGVDFGLERGEIHALAGDNGSGKSTLIKVLTGMLPKDGGTILLRGENFNPEFPQQAEQNGISTVYQELNLLPNLSVAENIFMERQPKKFGMIHWQQINTRSVEALQMFDLKIDVTRELQEYSIAVQQMVAIARALELQADVLILDEPASSLNKDEVEILFTQLRRVRDAGCAVIFVTHFLEQIYEICDRVTVLKHGMSVGTWRVEELPYEELVALVSPDEKPAAVDELQEASAVVQEDETSDGYAFITKSGLKLELGMLFDSGRAEFSEILLRIEKAGGSNVEVQKRIIEIKDPCLSFKSYAGLCSQEKQARVCNTGLTVEENLIQALQLDREWFVMLSRQEQEEFAQVYSRLFLIEASFLQVRVGELAEEDRLQLAFACCLASCSSLLMLAKAEQGIDIAGKKTGQRFIIRLSQQEVSLLIFPADFDEVLSAAEKAVILHEVAAV